MFLVFKKKNIVLFLLTLIISIFMFFAYFKLANASYYNPNAYTVVIDAGHGGIDGGKLSPSGIKESEINLSISKKLESFLIKSGFNVVMTRKDSKMLKNNKNNDMKERKRIIKEAEPDLVISVHCNSFVKSNVRGAQVFYSHALKGSSKNALIMQSALRDSLPASNKMPRPGDYYILNCSKYPALIVECGFLSNKEDEKLLSTNEYQEKVAFAIFSGINAIFAQNAEEN